ncbi:type II toxin-antitoxin system HicA family toxin [Methanosarcina sp.]|uniref:type II toxin-antitoxin system HicA family toxin n=1 Tax=Methanosarcina sp. TaxID=2213 RepID=UPI002C6EF970|nr:type II toxin-antitoxin system HicA family toxin [Methanosarcina sp.]HOW14047.1 type II toxin-antitoxin system HicA family toxin [Methanosarcina sp.]
MSRLLPINGREMCKILEMLGFQKVHQVGSHVRYVHPDGRKTVVPVHGNEDLGTGLIKEILKQARISREMYEELRKQV